MRKEVLLAIIVGVILGGVILVGIKLANNSVVSTSEQPTEKNNPLPTPTGSDQKLTILSPANHSVTTEKTLTVTGKSDPSATLALVSEEDDIILEASTEGTFSAEISLISGENVITVSQVLNDRSIITQKITVIQTSNLPE